MKGIVFNLLEQVVLAEHGEDVWEDILAGAGSDGVYTAVGTYPDEQLLALIDAGSRRLSVDADDLVRWFGRSAIPLLADRYPAFFSPHTSARAFVLTLNDVIHPEVRKLFPGAYAPQFEFALLEDEVVALGYRSHRGLCAFAEGLVEGAAAYYNESVSIVQTECAKRGAEMCVLRCAFGPKM